MAKITKLFKDTLVSFTSGLGLATRDKAATTEYITPVWTDQQLVDAYRSSWLARKIVNIPAFDAFRKWRSWQAEDKIIELIEKEEKRLGLKTKILETKVKARLFGGAALYIATGDPDPTVPLDPATIRKGGIKALNVMLRRHLNPGELDNNPESEWFNRPAYYELQTGAPGALTAGVRIHPSRLVIFLGEPLPDDELTISAAGRGWGDSILVSTMQAIMNADSTAGNIASLVFEAKIDVVKVPDLMGSLADPAYETRLLERFRLASVGKGINGTLILDAEEEYEQKEATFQTLPDILTSFLQICSGAADIPVTRLLGQSPAGLNATGESDLRNYYDRVQSIQELEITPAMQRLDECLIRSATGGRDEAIHYIWASLWQITDKERADIGKIDAETIKILNDTGLLPPEALASAGANMLVEHSIMPGLLEEIENAGGFPDFEAEAAAAEERARAEIAAIAAKGNPANNNAPERRAANDAAPKTLYVRRDVLNANEIKLFYDRQGLEVTVANLHVTIIHSRTPVDWFKVGETWEDTLVLNGGGPRDHAMFGPPGLEDSLVLMIASRSLKWRHEEMKLAGAVSDYAEFQPHITLRYKDAKALSAYENVEPYRGQIELGPEIFEEVED